MTFWGLCPACQARRSADADLTGPPDRDQLRPAGTSGGPWHSWSVDSDDLGLFGPGSVTWKVHAEPILIVAGLRSLYLQALHPRAMAGVAQNCDYRNDPWGRLVRTATYVATVVYGTTAEAEAAGAPAARDCTPGCGRSTRVTGERVPDRRAGPAALGARHRGRVVPHHRPAGRAAR